MAGTDWFGGEWPDGGRPDDGRPAYSPSESWQATHGELGDGRYTTDFPQAPWLAGDDSDLSYDRPADGFPPAARGRGRLVAGFALGAATVLGIQLGATVVASPPVAVVAGTAVPAAGAAAPAAASPSATPSPQRGTPSAAPAAQTPSSAAAPPSPPAQPAGTVRLPGGGTATLVRTDLGPGGELPVPTDLRQATWWGAELGAAGGASVFAGHVNWRGQTGPFAELWNDPIGAVVTIVDSAGKTWRYRISELRSVHKNDLPALADDLFGQSGPHRVVLVTCGGRWVGGAAGYEENRVVIADPS